ncbi:MAG: transcriptional regulator [Betaproteobacteria bacterium]|nr:MAG: transcriptional regulator [Betaproteobacteria bacterium]
MKLINIVANITLEERLVDIAEAHEASGYTVLDARGAGSAGLQTGALDGESNILFLLLVPESKLDQVLADVEKLMKRGHHLATFVSDTQVLRREKFD